MNADVGPRPQSVIDLSSVQAWTDVLELLPDAVFLVDDDGRISYLNSQASRMFGYERGELLNQSIDILVPQPVREHHGRHRRAYAQAPKLPTMGAGLALLSRRRCRSNRRSFFGGHHADLDIARADYLPHPDLAGLA